MSRNKKEENELHWILLWAMGAAIVAGLFILAHQMRSRKPGSGYQYQSQTEQGPR